MPALAEPLSLSKSRQAEPESPAVEAEQRLLLHNVPWDDYEQFCNLCDGHNVRLAYDQGTLELLSPSAAHGLYAYSSGHAVTILAEETNTPILPGRCVTLKRLAVRCGIESDNSFWIANESLVRDKEEIDLTIDPPPDLFVEVEVSRSFLDRLEIAARLKVPEVWRIRGAVLQMLLLQTDGTYLESDRSAAFPGFPVVEIGPFLQRTPGVDYISQMRRFREWVREQLGVSAAK